MLGTAPPYTDNWQHIADELARVELIVRAHLARMGVSASDAAPDPMRGLYLSATEVQRLLSPSPAAAAGDVATLLGRAEETRLLVAQRRAASLAAAVPLRLPLLSRRFGLTAVEEFLLLLCLAPEVDQRYERFYAYLNDDLTRKGPTLQLALALLCDDPAERARGRAVIGADRRMFRAGLLHSADDSQPMAGRLGRTLRIDERVADFLLGLDGLPAEIETFARLTPPAAASAPSSDVAARLAEAVRRHMESGAERRLVVQLVGPPGIGRRAAAQAACRHLETPLLEIDLEELAGRGESIEPALRLAAREALLQPAALYLSGVERLQTRPSRPDGIAGDGADDSGARAAAAVFAHGPVWRAIEDFSWLTLLETERPLMPGRRWREHAWLRVDLSAGDEAARVQWWEDALGAAHVELPAGDIAALAGRFRFTPGQIRAALRAARDEAHLRPAPPEPGSKERISAGDVARACRVQSGPLLEGLAQRIEPRAEWDDLVLPAMPLAQLREMTAEVRHRARVYGDWAFGERLSRGKGLAALFSGPSGTGKTLAAEVIAHDLELDLYRIDLSSVVSKYIGDTEKNLARLFAEAERGSAVLLFDEADALFGKRSEVKDAHDRYANIEISYLLQRIETYEGVVVLATNLRGNMDDAFLRRLQFVVEFPFPDMAGRREIWRHLFPARAPLAADVDLEFLATRLPLAGGNIKNIVRHAAFLAAANGGVIGMPHLMRAAKREYDKIGQLGSEADFGPYWPVVVEGPHGR
jgi:AAA+ superfamily predicted ATPase